MRKVIIILLALFSFILTGCSNTAEESSEEINIPTLKVTYNEENISVEKGGYQWTVKLGPFILKQVIADSASPDQIAEKMKGNEVPSHGELKLSFSRKPNKVTVVDWSTVKDNSYTFDDNTIIVPKEKGTYIYEIIGYWDEGQVSYTIKVIVNS
ncbi:hypothetical protein ACPWSR_08150 [Alloiococcus sp. CFN-8]|uniref:hypothetical protein n=1 Tax=Alloiococcus sp. CFN-8 TaxID=3416081 RepID=UPI003CE722A2